VFASRADVVASGSDAIAAIRQHDAAEPYDVVFMDWRMPGMDGLEASRHIKSDETLRHRPAIVLVTAFGREEVRDEAERLQLDGFLLKPVTRSTMVDTLVTLFGETGSGATVPLDTSEADRLLGARILLVEDNEINQQIAVELLEQAGARVTVAGNGRAAVELADGRADAGDGRLSGDSTASRRRPVRVAADHRDDRARHDGGTAEMSRGWDERSRLQTDRSGKPD
jgi:CheY-like chemotaxis protein